MTEQELREKIVKIALNTSWTDMFGDHYSIGESAANAIADALIAAGIGDLKEHRIFAGKDGSIKQLYSGEEVEQIVKERDEYKHRAERAERQARKACEVVFSEEIDNEPWDDMLYIYKDECGIDELGITSDMLYNYLKEQAEKELAEEGKND